MTQDPLPLPETDKGPRLHGNEDGTRGHYSGEEYDSYEKSNPRGCRGLRRLRRCEDSTARQTSRYRTDSQARISRPTLADVPISTRRRARYTAAVQVPVAATLPKITTRTPPVAAEYPMR
jgi:hypothetical protein